MAQPQASRARLPRDRAWQAIRILRRFTVTDVSVAAEVRREGARIYVVQLFRAGYLRRSYSAAGVAHYQLIRDSGPQPPRVVQHGTALHDGNSDTYFTIARDPHDCH